MATSFRLKHFSNPAALKQIDRVSLFGLLYPFNDFLKSRDPQVIVGEKIDYERLAKILMSPGLDTPMQLMEALFLIEETASIESPDLILDRAVEYNIDFGHLANATSADLAVAVWLKNPDILEAIHAEGYIVKAKKFDSYFTTSMSLPCYPAENDELLETIEQDLNKWFEKRKRGIGSKIFKFKRDDKIWFLVRHGELFKREGVLNGSESASIFYRPEKYDILFYWPEYGELAIHSTSEKDQIEYCKILGKHLFNNEAFFDTSGREKYTLEPLRTDGRAALSCADVDGIEHISFTELYWRYNSNQMHIQMHKANDIFEALSVKKFTIPKDATLTKASFKIKFKGSKSTRTVTIRLPSAAIFGRDSDADVVNEWLKKRGFINEVISQERADDQIQQAVAVS
ncbi:MAG: hypothetical protein ABFD79_12645 [Phycisphaerales bacterium]